jgi:hypothetical protein
MYRCNIACIFDKFYFLCCNCPTISLLPDATKSQTTKRVDVFRPKHRATTSIYAAESIQLQSLDLNIYVRRGMASSKIRVSISKNIRKKNGFFVSTADAALSLSADMRSCKLPPICRWKMKAHDM